MSDKKEKKIEVTVADYKLSVYDPMPSSSQKPYHFSVSTLDEEKADNLHDFFNLLTENGSGRERNWKVTLLLNIQGMYTFNVLNIPPADIDWFFTLLGSVCESVILKKNIAVSA